MRAPLRPPLDISGSSESAMFTICKARVVMTRCGAVYKIALVGTLASLLMGQPREVRAKRGNELFQGYDLRTGGRLFRKATERQSELFFAQLPVRNLNHHAKLAGVFDFDGDGQPEVFLEWTISLHETFVHHFQVYRIAGAQVLLIGRFAFEGGPFARIAFYEPKSTGGTPKTIFEVMGGTMWSTWYLLAPDGKTTQKLGSGTGYKFLDLEKNGTYNLVIYGERPFEPICPSFSYMSGNAGLSPAVLRKDAGGYTKIWPPADWLPYDFQFTAVRLKSFRGA